jgi:hypothetical protein
VALSTVGCVLKCHININDFITMQHVKLECIHFYMIFGKDGDTWCASWILGGNNIEKEQEGIHSQIVHSPCQPCKAVSVDSLLT